MSSFLIKTILLSAICCVLTAPLAAQKKIAARQQTFVTMARVIIEKDSVSGALYVTVNEKEKKVATEVGIYQAWVTNNGRSVVFSAPDGAGGYENEGNSLRIYDVATGKIKKIMSEYFIVDKVKEVQLSSGKIALLVEMLHGGGDGAHFAVVDPERGQVFRRQSIMLTKRTGDLIFLEFYRNHDWRIIFEGDEREKSKIKPYKREKYDLKKILKNRIIAKAGQNS